MGMLGQLFSNLIHYLPWPVTAAIVILFALWLGPGWWRSRKERYLRALVRQVTRADGGHRQRLETKIKALAAQDPILLTTLAKEANQRQLPTLRQHAIRTLKAGGHPVEHLKKLGISTGGIQTPDPTAFDAALAIRALFEAGVPHEAHERLALAQQRWPNDPDLIALAAWIEAQNVDESTGIGYQARD